VTLIPQNMITKPLSAVIIEDEEESLQLLYNLIQANGLAEVSGSTNEPGEAIDLIISLNPDILFLDIKMPGISGFDILDNLRKLKSVNPYIVFTTAFNEFAVKAFEYAAFDYLLKPVDPRRLADTILRCRDSRKSGHKQQADLLLSSYKKLIFRNTSGVVFIEPAEIVYIEAAGNYSVFHLTNNKTETVTMLLGKVEEHLSFEQFFRIGRSVIINLNYLKKVNSRQLECILTRNGFEFKCDISRDKVAELVDKMKYR
jgi:two-component system, LytTR family, response regulator